MKKKYIKPSFRVVELNHMYLLLAGSDKPPVPTWNGEGD